MLVVEIKAETFGSRFRSFRKSVTDPNTLRAISRERMAEMIGVCAATVRNWERDKTLPLASHRRELTRCFPGIFSRIEG